MPSSLEIQGYLRASAYAICFFDYLQTIPAELRLYARQKSLFRVSQACILFIIVRYSGLIGIVISNEGFFYHGFTPQSCFRYFWLTPVFKLILYMGSQAILGIRTYAISRKTRWVLVAVIAAYIIALVPEFISTFWHRTPFMVDGNCTSGNPPGIKMASLYYIAGLFYDVVTMSISFGYLFKFSRGASISSLVRKMLADGISYFAVLTAMNVINIIFFQSEDTVLQPAASSINQAATMIYSCRFVLNLSEQGREIDHSQSARHGVLPSPLQSPGFMNRGAQDIRDIMVTRTVEIDMDEFEKK